jgi:hypothetical protein
MTCEFLAFADDEIEVEHDSSEDESEQDTKKKSKGSKGKAAKKAEPAKKKAPGFSFQFDDVSVALLMQPGTMGLIELFKYREIYQVLKRVQRSLTSMTVP